MFYGTTFCENATANAEDAIARQEAESAKAHSAFLVYVHLPPGQRSLSAAYRAYRGDKGAKQGEEGAKGAPAYFEAWSAEWEWVSRAEKYDFCMGQVTRARIAEQRLEDIQAFRDKVKKVSDTKLAFFARVSNLVHRRLSECEAHDTRAKEQLTELLEAERAASLSGEVVKRPSTKPALPTPVAEYEALIRSFARAGLVADSGLSAEMKVNEISDLLEVLHTERGKEEE